MPTIAFRFAGHCQLFNVACIAGVVTHRSVAVLVANDPAGLIGNKQLRTALTNNADCSTSGRPPSANPEGAPVNPVVVVCRYWECRQVLLLPRLLGIEQSSVLQSGSEHQRCPSACPQKLPRQTLYLRQFPANHW